MTRKVDVDADLAERAAEKAQAHGERLEDVIERLLAEYTEPEKPSANRK